MATGFGRIRLLALAFLPVLEHLPLQLLPALKVVGIGGLLHGVVAVHVPVRVHRLSLVHQPTGRVHELLRLRVQVQEELPLALLHQQLRRAEVLHVAVLLKLGANRRPDELDVTTKKLEKG